MSRDNPESFAFYESFYEAIKSLSTAKERDAIYDAVCQYGLYGKKVSKLPEAANALFIAFTYQIDSAKSKRATHKKNSAKGGKVKNKSLTQKVSEGDATSDKKKSTQVKYASLPNEVSDHDVTSHRVNHNGNDNKNDKDNGRDKKIAYGKYQNVFLSPSEIQALRQDFPSDLMNRIERLSLYKSSSGKSYPDDAATIRLWADRDKEKQPANNAVDEDTLKREQMLDDNFDEAMEDIWREVDARNAQTKQEKGEDDAEKA